MFGFANPSRVMIFSMDHQAINTGWRWVLRFSWGRQQIPWIFRLSWWRGSHSPAALACTRLCWGSSLVDGPRSGIELLAGERSTTPWGWSSWPRAAAGTAEVGCMGRSDGWQGWQWSWKRLSAELVVQSLGTVVKTGSEGDGLRQRSAGSASDWGRVVAEALRSTGSRGCMAEPWA